MSSKAYLKILLVSFLIGIGISFVGCGSSNSPSIAIPPTNSTSSQALVGGIPGSCDPRFGRETFAQDGTRVCQTTVYPVTPLKFLGPVPRLSQADPRGVYAYQMNIQVQQYDKLKILDVQGGWGTSRYIFTEGKCSSVDGVGRALYISTGTASYPVVGPHTEITFNESGALRYGFDVNSEQATCHSLRITFKVERCLDVASLPHKCK
jgi:hypothetical protein